jgi:hypothetical protein
MIEVARLFHKQYSLNTKNTHSRLKETSHGLGQKISI